MYRITKKRCIACGQCIEVCQQHAIYMIDEEIYINHAKCNDCGLCIPVCPQNAITNRAVISNRLQPEQTQGLRRDNTRSLKYDQ